MNKEELFKTEARIFTKKSIGIAMALIQPEMITVEWKESFFNDGAAIKAYKLLGQSFTGVTWPPNAMIFKSYVEVLGRMKRNVATAVN